MSGPWGAFGKIPALGDFLRAGAPAGFVEVWDGWLQSVLMAARRDLGPRWQGCYFSAPIWRFTLAQGLAGPLPVAGVLMPSIDRVGRQYPLTLMTALPQGTPVILSHLAADAAFARLEDLALEVLDRDLARAPLLQRLGLLPRLVPPRRGRMADLSAAVTLQAPAHGAAGHLLGANLAAGLLDARLRQPALCSAVLAEGTRLMITEGLPSDARATALFDLSAPVWAAEGAP